MSLTSDFRNLIFTMFYGLREVYVGGETSQISSNSWIE